MSKWQQRSTAEQLAEHLREELRQGRWQGKMPGVIRLANELGVPRNTVEAALLELEKEGILRGQGRGRGRIVNPEGHMDGRRQLRVAILASNPCSGSLLRPHWPSTRSPSSWRPFSFA